MAPCTSCATSASRFRAATELAYFQTYGLAGEFQGRHRRFNVSEYRFAVHTFIPRIAYAVTLLRRSHEPRRTPAPTP